MGKTRRFQTFLTQPSNGEVRPRSSRCDPVTWPSGRPHLGAEAEPRPGERGAGCEAEAESSRRPPAAQSIAADGR